MSTRWKVGQRAAYSQGMTYPTVEGLYRMSHLHPCRAPRRVVLAAISRRDAAQRLSLAFTLLVRGQTGQGVAPSAGEAATRPTGTPAGSLPQEEAVR